MGKRDTEFSTVAKKLTFSVGTLIGRGKKPSIKQSVQALKVYKAALEKDSQQKHNYWRVL